MALPRSTTLLGLLAMGLWLGGCGDDSGRSRDGDGGVAMRGCDVAADADRDGIPDDVEGDWDTDGDGVVNAQDSDSDGDGLLDSEEAGALTGCVAVDTDGDGDPDFLDGDSDNDGLGDGEERMDLGTNPYLADSDGDGVTDLGEVRGSGTDPNDAASTIADGDFFVVLPYQGPEERRTLRFGTSIQVADVFLLVDMTGSMQGERTNLVNGVTRVIIPGISAAIPDVQIGAGGFDDYPVAPYGSSTQDQPFYLLREIGPADEDRGRWSVAGATAASCPLAPAEHDIGAIAGRPNGKNDLLEAIEGLPCHSGHDGPESYVPALHATATGEGLRWEGGRIPDQMCARAPDSFEEKVGYPCFRPGALPIVLLFGDAPFHNGPRNANPYDFAMAPTYSDTVEALNEIGARVMSVFSGADVERLTRYPARVHYEQLALDTGAVRADGSPLVFDISADGSGLSDVVVDAVTELVGGTPQDVHTRPRSLPGNPDDFDATEMIRAITPAEGYRGGIAGTGYDGKNETTFFGVIPGTDVEFAIDFQNGVRRPGRGAEIFRAEIVVLGNGVAELDVRNVYIVVPPDGGVILI